MVSVSVHFGSFWWVPLEKDPYNFWVGTLHFGNSDELADCSFKQPWSSGSNFREHLRRPTKTCRSVPRASKRP